MTFRQAIAIVVVTVGPAVTSCHKGASSNPNPVSPREDLTGTWVGSVVDNEHGPGSAALTVTALPLGVTGTWSFTFAAAGRTRSGTLGGTSVGTTVSWFMTPAMPTACGVTTISGTLALAGTIEGGRLRGQYIRITCDSVEGGSIDVTKRP